MIWRRSAATIGPAARATTPTSPTERHHGFTLIELMVVLFVMAGVMALAIPRLRPPGPTLERQAALIVDRLRSTRRSAIEDGTIRQVTAGDLADMVTPEFALTTPNGEDTPVERIVFYPLGNSNGASWMLDGAGQSITIRVDWLSGRIWSAPTP